jgi:hypothetical protein
VLRAAQTARRLRRPQPRQTDDDSFAADEVELLEQIGPARHRLRERTQLHAAEHYRQESIEQRDRLRLLIDVNNQLLAQLNRTRCAVGAGAGTRVREPRLRGAGDLRRRSQRLRIEAHLATSAA